MLLPSSIFLFPPPPPPLPPADPGSTSVWMGHALLFLLHPCVWQASRLAVQVAPPPGPALLVYPAPGNSLWGFETLSKETAWCCVTDDLSGESRLGQPSTGSRCFSRVQRACGCWPDGGCLLSPRRADSRK